MTAPLPRKSRWALGVHGLGWGGVLLAVLWAAGFACFVNYTTSLRLPDAQIKTDAIVVVTGGANRINTGLDMLQDRLAKQLFISGVGEGVSEADLVNLWKPATKKPPCCITLGRKAHNTAENAMEVRAWVQEKKIRSFRLVTSAYHIPRAWLELHHAMPEAEILLCPAAPAHEGMEKKIFLPLAFIEYNKTLMAFLRLYFLPPTMIPDIK